MGGIKINRFNPRGTAGDVGLRWRYWLTVLLACSRGGPVLHDETVVVCLYEPAQTLQDQNPGPNPLYGEARGLGTGIWGFTRVSRSTSDKAA